MRLHPQFINVSTTVAQNKNAPHGHNFSFCPGMGGKTEEIW
ncbi:hypothetical protein Nmel_008520 [Mimus melanotis]